MSNQNSKEIKLSVVISDSATKRAGTVDIANAFAKVIFHYFFTEWDGLIVERNGELFASEEELQEFIEFSWVAVSAMMASSGFNLAGIDDDGNYIVKFKPKNPIKDFLINNDIMGEDGFFLEDFSNDASDESTFGRHDDLIIGQ